MREPRLGEEPRVSRRRARRAWRSGQRGLTLLETIVALGVVAIGVVGIAGGFDTIVRDGGIAEQQTRLEATAASAASHIQAVDAYAVCAHRADYQAQGGLPSGVTVVSVSMSGQEPPLTRGGSLPNHSGTAPFGDCGATDDYGAQLISIKACDSTTCVTQTFWKGWDTLGTGNP